MLFLPVVKINLIGKYLFIRNIVQHPTKPKRQLLNKILLQDRCHNITIAIHISCIFDLFKYKAILIKYKIKTLFDFF